MSSSSPDQPMAADGQTVSVDLEAVPQPGLHDAFAALDLADQTVDVGHEVVVDAAAGARRRSSRAAAHRSPAPDRPAAPCARAATRRVGTAGRVCQTSSSASSIGRPVARSTAQTYGRTTERSSWASPIISDSSTPPAATRCRRRSRSVIAVDAAQRRPPRRAERVRTAGASRRSARRGRAASLRASASSGILRQLVGGDEHRAERAVGRLDAVVRGEQFARFDRVEQVVDVVFGVGGDDHGRALPAVRDLGLDQRVAERVPVGDRSTRRARTSVDGSSSASTIGNGPSSSSNRSNSASIVCFERFGDDDLVAVPDVREFGGGERLGQLGALVEVPRREVVVDLHDRRGRSDRSRSVHPSRRARCVARRRPACSRMPRWARYPRSGLHCDERTALKSVGGAASLIAGVGRGRRGSVRCGRTRRAG